MRVFPTTVLSACFLLLLLWLAHQAWNRLRADRALRSETIDGLREATRIEPGNADSWLLLAGAEADATGSGASELRRALELNPANSRAWIEHALRQEFDGNVAQAERELLRAAQIDRTFLPRWSLANFYFRHGQPRAFWTWARQAAELAYDDVDLLFDLCWRMAGDGRTVLEEAIPPRREIERKYFAYLLKNGRLQEAGEAAARLLPGAQPDDRDLLLDYCDRVLNEGQPDAAGIARLRDLWKALIGRGLLPYAEAALTNGDFETPISSRGFDWHLRTNEGITITQHHAPPELAIALSGAQPERCDLLEQWLPLEGGAHNLIFEAQSSRPADGVQWEISERGTAKPLARAGMEAGWLRFETRPGLRLVRLALVYERAPGTARKETELTLRNVRME